MHRHRLVPWFLAAFCAACSEHPIEKVPLSRQGKDTVVRIGARFPDQSEVAVVGGLSNRISRKSPDFSTLVRCEEASIVFKDEEGTGSDRMMTPRLRGRLSKLSQSVERAWPGVRLRVTEAWDEASEHGENSLHYEGRAADLTTSDLDSGKLGRLSLLAVEAGLDWVFYENASHVHGSVAR